VLRRLVSLYRSAGDIIGHARCSIRRTAYSGSGDFRLLAPLLEVTTNSIRSSCPVPVRANFLAEAAQRAACRRASRYAYGIEHNPDSAAYYNWISVLHRVEGLRQGGDG